MVQKTAQPETTTIFPVDFAAHCAALPTEKLVALFSDYGHSMPGDVLSLAAHHPSKKVRSAVVSSACESLTDEELTAAIEKGVSYSALAAACEGLRVTCVEQAFNRLTPRSKKRLVADCTPTTRKRFFAWCDYETLLEFAKEQRGYSMFGLDLAIALVIRRPESLDLTALVEACGWKQAHANLLAATTITLADETRALFEREQKRVSWPIVAAATLEAEKKMPRISSQGRDLLLTQRDAEPFVALAKRLVEERQPEWEYNVVVLVDNVSQIYFAQNPSIALEFFEPLAEALVSMSSPWFGRDILNRLLECAANAWRGTPPLAPHVEDRLLQAIERVGRSRNTTNAQGLYANVLLSGICELPERLVQKAVAKDDTVEYANNAKIAIQWLSCALRQKPTPALATNVVASWAGSREWDEAVYGTRHNHPLFWAVLATDAPYRTQLVHGLDAGIVMRLASYKDGPEWQYLYNQLRNRNAESQEARKLLTYVIENVTRPWADNVDELVDYVIEFAKNGPAAVDLYIALDEGFDGTDAEQRALAVTLSQEQ